jgi:SAM-dependent methyltransferase
MTDHTYVGGELELFAHAQHWKRYWIDSLRKYIRGSVLEVGAGIGANTSLLRNGSEPRWVCLEPDAALASTLRENLSAFPSCATCEVRASTIELLPPAERFDSILYIDVLEHIQDDEGEVHRAARHLNPGGAIIALSPAHDWLFSEFDRAIGHCRRYTTRALAALTPPGLKVARTFYLDSVGLLASAGNRFLLRQSLPNAKQIRLWDDLMVPCSRFLDPLTNHRLGKTAVCVWERKS